MEPPVKSYKLDLNIPEGVPTGVWDPLWDDPEVARCMALMTYGNLLHLPFDRCCLLPESELTELNDDAELRRFPLDHVEEVAAQALRFRGGSYGEIFKKFSFGPHPATNFHAQAVSFGVDSTGRFYLYAQLGMVGSTLDNEAALVLTFADSDCVIGGLAWEGAVQNHHNVVVQIVGTDERLRDRFDHLTEAVIRFDAACEGV